MPTKWSPESGISWTTELPGRGSSSPITYQDNVFVTAATGYGNSAKEPGKVDDLVQHLLCLDAHNGSLRWKKSIKGSGLTMRLNENLLRHGFASSTPTTDGELVYAFFGQTGLFAFDLEGNLVWQADCGFGYNYFGSSASLTVYKDLLIVNASIESKSVFAFNKKTGEGVWRIEGIDRSWSMPVIGANKDGKDELVLMEEGFVRGYNPETGEELWHCEGVNNYVIATPFLYDGIAYCNGGIEKQMMAIRLGGSGDVTETHKLWEVPMGANVSSPIYLTGYVFLVADNGILQCFEAATGKLVSKSRLPTKSRFYASPLLAGDKLYFPLEDNGVYVCEASSKTEKVSHNQFDPDKNSLKASFAAGIDMSLLIRNDKKIYCFGKITPELIENKVADFSDDSELIIPRPRYDFDKNTKRVRVYQYYIDLDPEICRMTVIAPYRSVITDEQKTEAYKIINDDFAPFDEMRQRYADARWAFLQSGSKDEDALIEKLKVIEKEATAYADKVRVKIKKLFSKEQMDQHLKEAAERRAKAKKK
jgi:outer membrane protein assembly factor BamB